MTKQIPSGSWRERHSPYSDWLLGEEPLQAEQDQALQEHLQSCSACRELQTSLNGIDVLFRSVPQTAPASGFTARFQQRLAEERSIRKQQQSWIFLLVTFGVTGLTFLLLEAQAVQMLNSPSALGLYVMSRLTSIYVLFESSENIAGTIFQLLPKVLPVPLVAIGLGMLSLLSVLWFVSISHAIRRGETHE